MNDTFTSWLRTAVPILWGSLVVWFAETLPNVNAFLESVGIDLDSPGTVLWVSGAAIALWYALFRKIEPHLPPWLTRLVLGSNQTPRYGEE
jgi:hypothetical protein